MSGVWIHVQIWSLGFALPSRFESCDDVDHSCPTCHLLTPTATGYRQFERMVGQTGSTGVRCAVEFDTAQCRKQGGFRQQACPTYLDSTFRCESLCLFAVSKSGMRQEPGSTGTWANEHSQENASSSVSIYFVLEVAVRLRLRLSTDHLGQKCSGRDVTRTASSWHFHNRSCQRA